MQKLLRGMATMDQPSRIMRVMLSRGDEERSGLVSLPWS